MTIETALAKVSTAARELRDPEKRYHIYTVADFQKLAPDFDFAVYFKDIKVGHFDTLNVATPDFFKGLNELIASRAGGRVEVVPALARDSRLGRPTCPRPFATRISSSSGRRWPDRRSRLRAGSSAPPRPTSALGEAVGQDWVKENFPPKAKASMDQLVAALEKSLADDIKTLPWMSDETKKAAEEKLALYPQQDRLSGEVARLLRADRRAR